MTERRPNHPGIDSAAPHAIDHGGYAAGTARPEAMLALEAEDEFWQTLGGSREDPWNDGGETFRQRQRAVDLGIGMNIYGPMGYSADEEIEEWKMKRPDQPLG